MVTPKYATRVRNDNQNNALVAFNIGQTSPVTPMQYDFIMIDIIREPLMHPNTIPKVVFDPPFTPYVGKYGANTGLLDWLNRYGIVGDDNRITGLEYCPFDDTIIISGYGFGSYTPEPAPL